MHGPQLGVQKCTSTSRLVSFATTLADSKSLCQWTASCWAIAGTASNALKTTISVDKSRGDQWCRMDQPSASRLHRVARERNETPLAHPRLRYRTRRGRTLVNLEDFAGRDGRTGLLIRRPAPAAQLAATARNVVYSA